MTFKQMTAWIQIVAAVIVGVWLLQDVLQPGAFPETIGEAAKRLLWALLFIIGFNILASIVLAIVVSIVQREELKDEWADERDKTVNARAGRNAYYVLSILGACTLLFLALGGDPAGAAYMLFAALMVAGATDAASRLLYYRLG